MRRVVPGGKFLQSFGAPWPTPLPAYNTTPGSSRTRVVSVCTWVINEWMELTGRAGWAVCVCVSRVRVAELLSSKHPALTSECAPPAEPRPALEEQIGHELLTNTNHYINSKLNSSVSSQFSCSHIPTYRLLPHCRRAACHRAVRGQLSREQLVTEPSEGSSS